MDRTRARFLVVALLGWSCQSGPEAPPAHGNLAPSSSATPVSAAAVKPSAPGALQLGTPIAEGETMPLARLVRDSKTLAQHRVKTEGKVTAVCQAMGCWMEISDAATQAHIRMSGHRFFVPKDASGRHAVVEGTLLAAPDDGECEREAKESTGRTVKLELDATGVLLL